MLVFTAILFTIAMIWKQAKCPSTEEWIKKIRYIYTMEYCSAIKGDEVLPFTEMWLDIETLIQSVVKK